MDYYSYSEALLYCKLYNRQINEREYIVYKRLSFRETWKLNGVLHRRNGPAKIIYYQNGNIYSLTYYQNGLNHRMDGPAYIEYDRLDNHLIDNIRYHVNDLYHRTDGPARIFYTSGVVESEDYYENGKFIKAKDYIVI